MNFLIVTKYTFKECLKSKVLVSVFFLAVFLLIASFITSEMTYKTVHRVAVDIGFGLSTISAVGMSIFLGVNLISNEIENRTLYMVLSKPISRSEFYLGKFLGLSLMTLLNVLILTSQTYLLSLFFGGKIDPLFFYVGLFIYLESLIILSITVLLSMVTNKYLTIFFVLVLYTVGYALDSTVQTRMVSNFPLLKSFLQVIELTLPMFYKINFKDLLIYKEFVPGAVLLKSFIYACSYILCINFLGLLIFNRRDLN